MFFFYIVANALAFFLPFALISYSNASSNHQLLTNQWVSDLTVVYAVYVSHIHLPSHQCDVCTNPIYVFCKNVYITLGEQFMSMLNHYMYIYIVD